MDTPHPDTEVVAVLRKPMGKARVKPRHLSPVIWELIIDQFRVRKPSEDVAEELAVKTIVGCVPPSPDRSAAIRKIREARMDCNSAITHGGKY